MVRAGGDIAAWAHHHDLATRHAPGDGAACGVPGATLAQPAGLGDDEPADEGNLPGFLYIALRTDLALSRPQQRDRIIARVALLPVA